MLTQETQKGYVVTARYGCDSRSAAQYANEVESLARRGMIAYSTRNQVRQELKGHGFQLPPRTR